MTLLHYPERLIKLPPRKSWVFYVYLPAECKKVVPNSRVGVKSIKGFGWSLMVALNFLQKQDLLRVVTLNCEILLQTTKNKNERPDGWDRIFAPLFT